MKVLQKEITGTQTSYKEEGERVENQNTRKSLWFLK
jgi:hypothetical protein